MNAKNAWRPMLAFLFIALNVAYGAIIVYLLFMKLVKFETVSPVIMVQLSALSGPVIMYVFGRTKEKEKGMQDDVQLSIQQDGNAPISRRGPNIGLPAD